MRPGVFNSQFVAPTVLGERKNPRPRMQPHRDIAMYLDGNFATPPLRLRHPRRGSVLDRSLRIGNLVSHACITTAERAPSFALIWRKVGTTNQKLLTAQIADFAEKTLYSSLRALRSRRSNVYTKP